jgi:protein-tyrosine phosphatase
MNAGMIRVLFVCLGNICPSPMAEAVLRHKVAAAGLADRVEVDSAGTGYWHVGEAPHRGTRRALDEKGISHAGMAARQIETADLDLFDYILTMDDTNYADVLALGPSRAVVRPLLSYTPELGLTEVPDPYYTGGFEGVYHLVDGACDELLAVIRAEHAI